MLKRKRQIMINVILILLTALIWINAAVDLHKLLLVAPSAPINQYEAIIETFMIDSSANVLS